MNIDEMKDRITRAEEIQLYTENRCEALEKQIEDLEEKLEKETAHRIRNFNKAIEWKEKHRTLEKENAELKYRLEHRNCVICSNHGSNIKLIKAKELLKKWVELFKPKGGNIPPTPIQVDTEQFLNSEVEKMTDEEVKKIKEHESKPAENKKVTTPETPSESKPTEKKSALKLPDEKSSFSTDVNRMKKLKKEDYKQYTIQLEKLHSKYPINKWKDLLNKTTQDEAPRVLTGDCRIRVRKA